MLERCPQAVCTQIPDARLAVRRASDDDPACGLRSRAGRELDERDRLDALALIVPAERADDLALAQAHYAHAPRRPADDRKCRRGINRERGDPLHVEPRVCRAELEDRGGRAGVPEDQGALGIGGDDALAIGREISALHGCGVSGEDLHGVA